jgi:hypothetical protein
MLAATATAADNAALARFGTTIAITCNLPHPLNDHWAKAGDMLRAVKPSGPIINDLASARVTIAFPVRLHVSGLAFTCSDYKGGWSRAREVAVEVGGEAGWGGEDLLEVVGDQHLDLVEAADGRGRA